MSNRRGVEMSLNLVIMIVLGLIVLIVLIYIVTRNTSNANRSITGCAEKGGECRSERCLEGETGSSFFSSGAGCPESNAICCFSDKNLAGNG
jgi:hypothetical protein